jgi:hypothetical protein
MKKVLTWIWLALNMKLGYVRYLISYALVLILSMYIMFFILDKTAQRRK